MPRESEKSQNNLYCVYGKHKIQNMWVYFKNAEWIWQIDSCLPRERKSRVSFGYFWILCENVFMNLLYNNKWKNFIKGNCICIHLCICGWNILFENSHWLWIWGKWGTLADWTRWTKVTLYTDHKFSKNLKIHLIWHPLFTLWTQIFTTQLSDTK